MKKRISDRLVDTDMFARPIYTRQDENFFEVSSIVGIEILVRCNNGRFTNFDARLRQSGNGGSIDAINRQRWMVLYAALARAFDPEMRGVEIVSKTDKMVADATSEFKAKKDGGVKDPKGYAARAFGRYGISSEIEEGRIALSAWLADDE
ncbi:hypothetical protein MKK64_04675 [Methylobacterium sp. E-025]|uniref:hypothetical protein n=1 Tax=Methylobacterium sp. E-025 TaxID=2836561 RepID=UPI001FBA6E56|nr:hypothetical protein [Methylobacterium sp. E-025]MCJ2110506.1 hypothetical protein [Methylobacterium sp. E-025]